MRISKVTDYNQYEKDIIQFKSNLINYQKAAAKTTHTNQTLGNNESFYAHVLFAYYLKLVDQLWKEYRVGIGIFTLQGYE